MKKLIFTLIFCVLICKAYSQIDKSSSYSELQTMVIELVQKNKIDSALAVMEYAYKNFPEEYQTSSALLANLYTRAGETSKAIAVWKSGMKKGYNYHLRMPGFEKYYKDNNQFNKLKDKEIAKISRAHIKHELILPTNYSTSNIYPVLFIFHGNGRNIEKSKESWLTPKLKDEYISVFVQSYIHSSDTDFIWWTANDEKTEREFKDVYSNILTNYPIDTSNIIFAGMSAGGKVVLEFAFKELVPISGLVLNCPVVPVEITDETISKFVKKKERIGIITGEKDFALDNQNSLIKRIKEEGGQSKITINSEIGHEFGQEFKNQLDEYLGWIN